MVKFIEVLHVSKDDVFLVDDPWRNLLDPTGHLPQVSLHKEEEEPKENVNNFSDVFPNAV